MTKPTKEELYYCYYTLDMKQSEIAKKFNYSDISRLLSFYKISKKPRGHFIKKSTQDLIQNFKDNREDKGEFYDYSQVKYVNTSTKIKIICPLHGSFYQFPNDHLRGFNGCKECGKLKRQKTCIEKYGVSCVFESELIKDKIKSTNLEKYGVENPSQSVEIKQKKIETSLKNYGVEHPLQSEIVKNQIKETNLEKYGVDSPMKILEISQKSVATRIINNTFCRSNYSLEARNYIRTYVDKKGYSLDQCAFSDIENNLFEWGFYYKDRWILYDLVVFELGFRGNKNYILEILEYNGPFHYTKKDVIERGNFPAYPWKSKKITIKESYEIDKIKEEFAKSLTKNFTIIWPERYHRGKNENETKR